MKKEAAKEQKNLRNYILKNIDKDFINELKQLKPFRTFISFTHIWASIVLSFILIDFVLLNYDLKSIVWLLPLSIFIATRQNALAVQVHEASHYHLFKSRTLNDLFCNIFASYWILNDVKSYRNNHLQHHRYLHTTKDPDKDLYHISTSKMNKFTLIKILVKDLFLITAISRIRKYLKLDRNEDKINFFKLTLGLITKLITQIIIFLYFYTNYDALNSLILWISFWVIPLFFLYPLIIRIRTVSEHYHYNNNEGNNFISRTTKGNIFINYLLGACMEYHFEHHLLPHLPHYNLKVLNNKLLHELKNPIDTKFNIKNKFINKGYLNYWSHLLKIF